MLNFMNDTARHQKELANWKYIQEKLTARFKTYHYQEAQTPIFENYDLYQTIASTVNTDEMVKIITPTGKVAVLRPDVTVPITKREAIVDNHTSHKRFFYTSSVFRHTDKKRTLSEQMQSGVENFEPESPLLDAEVLTLSIHALQDLGLEKFKCVIGNAGFFKELLKQIPLSNEDLVTLKELIQAKNVGGIKAFLDDIPLDQQSKHTLAQIPLLYGDPTTVLEKARTIASTGAMKEQVDRMYRLYDALTMFNVKSYIDFDLGLINHMTYYSDIIFQSFVEQAGKPILMGGRYNYLAEQIGNSMPAIGFALDTEALFQVMTQQALFPDIKPTPVLAIYYTPEKQKDAITCAQLLRDQNKRVQLYEWQKTDQLDQQTIAISYQAGQNLLKTDRQTIPFTSQAELCRLLEEVT